jgi:tetratricopeptide (TPR) repeat protein
MAFVRAAIARGRGSFAESESIPEPSKEEVPMRNSRVVLALAVILALVPGRSLAQHEHEHAHAEGAPERLGTVHFPTSCKPELEPAFERAVALLHSFAYVEAAKAFRDVAANDPGCAMAQWGIAMSYFHTIWGPPTPDEFAAGKAAAEKAASLAPTASARERDFIAAIGAYYRGDGVPHPERVAAFDKAMAGVAERQPDDHEAQIFHALAILAVAYNSPPDKTYARQKQAAAILNRLLALEPEHPGIAHYMSHSFDYPELAELALPAARAYSKIAPSAPHALHMPSHIFTRLGMWHESIESNLASVRTAQEWVARSHPGATSYDGLHAMDYLEYAYLQIGQDDKARALVDSVTRAASFDAPAFQAAYALAAVPARYALERRAWKDAAALAVRPAGFPWGKYPYAEAIVHFARAVGAARSGDLPATRVSVARLEAIEAGLRGGKGFDWATQIEIQRRAAQAWLARAEGKNDDALALLRSAADLEDATDKHPVTPGAVLPAREQLADLLLELKKPAPALVEYEASLRTAPARFNSYRGAAEAARLAGDAEKARTFKARLVAMCDGVVPDRMASSGP